MSHRIVSGTILIVLCSIVILGKSLWTFFLFLGIVCCVLTLSMLEFFALWNSLKIKGFPYLTILTGSTYLVTSGVVHRFFPDIIGNYEVVIGGLFFFCFLLIAWIKVFRGENLHHGMMSFLISLAALMYLGGAFFFMVKIYLIDSISPYAGHYLLLYVIIVTKCGDIGGYTGGKIMSQTPYGTRKMVPAISPKKSWEGLLGGVILSVLASCLLTYFFGNQILLNKTPVLTYGTAVLWGVICTFLGLIGDLSISALKRITNVKDSGKHVPGFGGILDVIDSLLIVPPFFYGIFKVMFL